jgi:autonomous glycyl radical cofactor GrcA
LKAAAEKNGEDAYKVKYDALKEDFNAFKAQQEEKEKHAKKADAYKALLQEVGISEKRIGSVLKVSDIDSIEFDDEGKVKEAETLKKAIAHPDEYADLVVRIGGYTDYFVRLSPGMQQEILLRTQYTNI